jgi:hypothetical protein
VEHRHDGRARQRLPLLQYAQRFAETRRQAICRRSAALPTPSAGCASRTNARSVSLCCTNRPHRGFQLGGAEHTHRLTLSPRSSSRHSAGRASSSRWRSRRRCADQIPCASIPRQVAETPRGVVVVYFVQHVAHPPVELKDRPDDDRRSRLAFVTRRPARERVARVLYRRRRSRRIEGRVSPGRFCAGVSAGTTTGRGVSSIAVSVFFTMFVASCRAG